MTRKKAAWFRRIERMLYDYKTYDSAIRSLEVERQVLSGPYDEDIMPQTSCSVVKLGQVSTKTPFDTSLTERWGIKRAELSRKRLRRVDRLLLEKRRHREGIRAAREGLTGEEAQFVWLKYDQEKTHIETRAALRQMVANMSESTYYRLRRRTIEKIAKFMGVL